MRTVTACRMMPSPMRFENPALPAYLASTSPYCRAISHLVEPFCVNTCLSRNADLDVFLMSSHVLRMNRLPRQLSCIHESLLVTDAHVIGLCTTSVCTTF